jgi:hypothetical protein
MLSVQLNETDGLAIVQPQGELSADDFESAAKIIDPYIERTGKLNGIIIRVEAGTPSGPLPQRAA